MRLSPYYPDWYRWSLGRAYRLAGRYDEAVAALSAGLQRHPDALAPRVELVTAYSEMGQIDKARATAAEVRRINPGFVASDWTRNPRHVDPEVALREFRALRRAGLPG